MHKMPRVPLASHLPRFSIPPPQTSLGLRVGPRARAPSTWAAIWPQFSREPQSVLVRDGDCLQGQSLSPTPGLFLILGFSWDGPFSKPASPGYLKAGTTLTRHPGSLVLVRSLHHVGMVWDTGGASGKDTRLLGVIQLQSKVTTSSKARSHRISEAILGLSEFRDGRLGIMNARQAPRKMGMIV